MNATKMIVLAVVLIIGGIIIFFFTREESKDVKQTTTNQTKTGLASLDLGGMISSIYGGKGQRVSMDNSYTQIQ